MCDTCTRGMEKWSTHRKAPDENRVLRCAVVAAMLAVHLYTRYVVSESIPLSGRGDGLFSTCYQAAVNVAAGRGFYYVNLPARPEATPILQFELLQREEITPLELKAYLNQPWSRPAPSASALGELYTARPLELRVAGLLWRCFGVRWSVLFTFYQLVSTAAAFLVFLIGRKAGGYWCGVLAAMLYTLSPIENMWVTRNIRDINPLWFAALGCAAVYCLAGSFRNRWLNLASYPVAGFAAVIGYGWRLDALLLPPVLLMLLIVKDLMERSDWRRAAGHAALFALGAFACYGFIQSLKPPGSFDDGGEAFHVALYGNSERTNLAGLEDSLRIFREDVDTIVTAQYYARANDLPGHGEPLYSPAYSLACRALYLRALSFDAWHWTSGFPRFTMQAMRGTTLRDLPMDRDWLPPLPPLLQVLSPVASVLLPGLTLVGIAAVLFWGRPSPITTGMVAFLAIYLVVLFAVLPEHQHSGMLVLPMCVLGEFGVVSAVSRNYRDFHGKAGVMALLVAMALWGIASGGAYFWSQRQRAAQIEAIERVAAGAIIDPTIKLLPQSMSVMRDATSRLDRAGYLLEIEAGAAPGILKLREVRATLRGTQPVGWTYESEHRLHPGRRQFFFFTSYEGRRVEPFKQTSSVTVQGDARIISVRCADLTNWRGLPVSTVFYDGEHSPGSPVVGHPSEISIYSLPQ